MTILITGGAGFIGSHLGEALLRDGHSVVALDNFDPFYDPAIKRANLALLEQWPAFQFVEGDIRDQAIFQHIFSKNKVDAVVHLAAKAGVRPSILQPAEYNDVNVNGTLQLLEAMVQAKVPRLLFASSSSVYGNQEKTPFSETDDVSHPISPYAATKRAGELLAYTYHHLYGLDIACLRLFTVYGPRQRPDLAIHKFAHLALENKPIPLYGDGQTRRDYTYVTDTVAGIRQVLDLPGVGYDIFNLGGGAPVTLLEMVEALETALGRKLEKQFLEKQPGDVDQTFADVSKAKAHFGYQPQVSLHAGVKYFADWFYSSYDSKS
ncbi:MAG: GDP-mannose 4,6-dehydratase [Lewinellaceae bacterium]|nr:GDP-mannose 4,6-dehydratase [Saprospiraceae bacterium]MCB9330712.1 GDP-mannose 4,6-dehydratase [Lewinellaceae bacterium]